MKPRLRVSALALLACALLALLPACGVTPHRESPRLEHTVTMIEPDGTQHAVRASTAGVHGVERHAEAYTYTGEAGHSQFYFEGGDAWGVLAVLGAILGLAIIFGITWLLAELLG